MMIDYEARIDTALRGAIREILLEVAESGLPGDHHFYIRFRTEHPGVVMAKHLRETYPDEMMIVLQNQFWNLQVEDEYFSVTLRFNGTEQRIEIPFEAVLLFVDPSVKFGLRLPEPGMIDTEASNEEALLPAAPAQVVQIEDFRR